MMAAKGKHLRADDLTVEIRVTCNSERYEGVITGYDLLVWETPVSTCTLDP